MTNVETYRFILTGTVHRTYNVFGNPVYEKATDKNGENAVVTTYGYDSLGRLTRAVCDGYS